MNKTIGWIFQLLLVVTSLSVRVAEAVEIVWTEIQLESASGVPDSPDHSYRFKGMLKAYGEKRDTTISFGGLKSSTPVIATATIWAEGSGKWEQVNNYAEEKLGFGGGEKGILVTRYWCEKDPWLYQTNCRVLGAVYSSKLDLSYDWAGIVYQRRLPLTQPAVTLGRAEYLSRKESAASRN